ncbi:MAG: flagellar biosynthetic protein FliO [Planctomycetaceae bacterium]
MNLRTGLTSFACCCASIMLLFSAVAQAEDGFQPPRQQPQNGYEFRSQPGTVKSPVSNARPDSNNYPQNQANFPNRELPADSRFNPPGTTPTGSITTAANPADFSTTGSLKEDLSSASADARPIGTADRKNEATSNSDSPNKLSLISPGKMLTAVTFVIFLILVTAKYWKRHIPGASIPIPTESLTVLGERKLNKQHSICLVRLGSRVLVLGASPDGLRTLTEITDPVEIDFLSGMARSNQPDSVFTAALGSFMKKTTTPASLLSSKTATGSSATRPSARSAEVNRG